MYSTHICRQYINDSNPFHISNQCYPLPDTYVKFSSHTFSSFDPLANCCVMVRQSCGNLQCRCEFFNVFFTRFSLSKIDMQIRLCSGLVKAFRMCRRRNEFDWLKNRNLDYRTTLVDIPIVSYRLLCIVRETYGILSSRKHSLLQ